MKKSLYILGVGIALLMSSCADSWLDQHPGGSTITEEQYANMDDVLEGTVVGIMSSMNDFGNHDWFGQRSIDMYGDFTCGDMAMKTCNAGWFLTDELGQSYSRRGTLWSYYYDIVRACNKALNVVHQSIDQEKLSDEDYIAENAEHFYYLAEILALRGWAYDNLQKWFCYTPKYIIETLGESLDEHKSIPLYTENDTKADTIYGNDLSSVTDVYLRIEEDFTNAIYYFDIVEEQVSRSMLQEINSDVVRLFLAYHYLNAATTKEDYKKAATMAEEFINLGHYELMDTTNLLTTGFAECKNDNWVWGQDINVQTTTCLGSFFGQCDIYSYSYAAQGDIKGIDQALYDQIPEWDLRKNWWNNTFRGCKECQWAPDGKFYSPMVKQSVGYSRKALGYELDRDWLCDQVFMRAELGYMIAAEAYARADDADKAYKYLDEILSRRYINKSDYDTYMAGLNGNITALLEAIHFNWRVEFWGEGFGLQTFRRFDTEIQLGTNHKSRTKVSPNDPATLRSYSFEIPSGEEYYNPYLHNDKTELEEAEE